MYEVYLLTDPDEAGYRYANTLLSKFPNLIHIQVDPKECEMYNGKRKIYGIEFCSGNYIKKVLDQYINKIPYTV